MVDVNEPTVIILPTKVGPADTQLRCERRVADEECTCLLPPGKSLLRKQHRGSADEIGSTADRLDFRETDFRAQLPK
jgi:hypothetical protein